MEGAGELRCGPVVDVEATAVTDAVAAIRPGTSIVLLLLLKPELHQILELGLDVGEDGEAAEVSEATSLISKLLRLYRVDLTYMARHKTGSRRDRSQGDEDDQRGGGGPDSSPRVGILDQGSRFNKLGKVVASMVIN